MARRVAGAPDRAAQTPVVVENKEGAGGTIGALATVSRSGCATRSCSRRTPVCGGALSASRLCIRPDHGLHADRQSGAHTDWCSSRAATRPSRTSTNVVAYGEKRIHGKLDYASSGIGTPSHLNVEVIKRDLGLDIAAIPLQEHGQAMADLLGGTVKLYMPSFPRHSDTSERPSASFSPSARRKRSPVIPEVPTVAEVLRQPGTDAVVWYGFLAPKGLPAEVRDRLYAEIAKAAASPKLTETFASLGRGSCARRPERIRAGHCR